MDFLDPLGPPADEIILAYLSARSSAVSIDEMQRELKIPLDVMQNAANTLAGKRRIEVLRGKDDSLYFKFVNKEDAAKLQGLSHQESIVFAAIKEAGSVGIWTRDLKMKTGIAAQQLTKILKTLETKQLVKAFTSVQKKKVYLVFELEPAKSISGGPWFANGEPDKEFVDALHKFTLSHFERAKKATLTEIHQAIIQSHIATVELSREEVLQLVRALMYDGHIEVDFELKTARETVYRYVKTSEETDCVYATLPCAACPVFSVCGDTSVVNPASCQYYTAWLSQF